MERITAIVLAGGSGSRMKSPIPKQYMDLAGRPVLFYSLSAFAKSEVTDIVLVAGAGEADYCKKEIIARYGIPRVRAIAEGGRERADSVYAGLLAAEGADYVLIHDGARPLVSPEVIARSIEAVRRDGACVAGMPAKDTIKVVDSDGYAVETPDRSSLYIMQTPQSFSYPLIRSAYEKYLGRVGGSAREGANAPDGENARNGGVAGADVVATDDAMVLELAAGKRARIIEGSYGNIKVTTPEDMVIAEALLAAAPHP